MGRKILIVGGVTGGASCAARLRRLDETAEIVIFERGSEVSYSSCCLPYFLSRTVADSDSLVLVSPEKFRRQYNIEARTGQEVMAIDRENKRVRVRRLADGHEYEERYDVLVLSPGGDPIVPPGISGAARENVFTVHNVADIERLDAFVRRAEVRRVVVVGGGFAGLEMAENLSAAGLSVTLVEAANQLMTPFDFDMAQILTKELLDRDVALVLGDSVQSVADSAVTLASGREIAAEAVILAIGIRPAVKLAADCGLALGNSGGIRVDHNYQTSDPAIYAVGDAVEVYNRLPRRHSILPMAWPAQMAGRAAADHINGRPHRGKGFIGSAVLRVFSLYAAGTGLTEKAARAEEIPAEAVYVIPQDKVKIMPGSAALHLKLIFETPTGRILGAQAIGGGEAVSRRIDVIAALIAMGGTLEDLKETELCYTPAVGTTKDAVHMAALVGLNLLDGRFRQVAVDKARGLVEEGAYIIDVREAQEYAAGHFRTAVNLPLSELRQRLDEIPKDRPVYLHCRSGQRSYNAVMALQQLGFDNVWNMAGSYLGVCLFEYARDVMEGREKIVTAYNFT